MIEHITQTIAQNNSRDEVSITELMGMTTKLYYENDSNTVSHGKGALRLM